MSKPFYVKYEMPKEIADAAYEALQIASKTGVVRKARTKPQKQSRELRQNSLS